MKKVQITVFVSFLLLFMNAMAQNEQELISNGNEMDLYSPFALDLFNGFLVSSEPASDLTLLSIDTIKEGYGRNEMLMRTFRDKSGKCISLISRDKDNFIWFVPKIQQNKITGENEIIPKPTDNIISFKKLRDDFGFAYYDGVALFANLIPEAEYVITNQYKKNRIPRWEFSDWVNQSDSEKERRIYYNIIAEPITFQSPYSSEESCKNQIGVLSSNLYVSKKERVPLSVSKYYSVYNNYYEPTFRKHFSDYFVEYAPKLNQVNSTLYLEPTKGIVDPSKGITLSYLDKIQSLSKEGNIISITFEQPGDFLKYTLFSHGVFDGKLTRKNGYFILKNDNPEYGVQAIYYNTQPLQVEHYDPNYSSRKLGVMTVPAGLHTSTINPRDRLLANYDSNQEIFYNNAKSEFWFYDDNEEHILTTYFPGAIFHKDGVKIAAQQEAAEKAAYEKKKAAILNKYKQKYGATTIDNIMKGIIKVGMPWSLIKQVFANGVFEQSNYSTTYKVINNIPKLNLKEETIEIQEYGLGTLHYVTVRNGKVSNVWTTNHR